MSIQSESDWRGLRRAAAVARETLDALERNVRVGITTLELDRIAARIFAKRGARSAPALVYGFPGTVLISVNDEIVHGVPGQRRLKDGDVVKLDVTVERDRYVADAARTVIAGAAAADASRLRECAIAAFEASLAVARAGNKVREIGRVIEHEVRGRGFTIVRGLSGHGVGRTIHEPPTVHNHYVATHHEHTLVITNGAPVLLTAA